MPNVRRTAFTFSLVIAFAISGVADPLSAQDTSTCLAADNQTAFLGVVLTRFLSATDTRSSGLRQKLNLPQLSADSISLVTDAKTCDKAVPAVNAAQGRTKTRRLYVYKLGNSRFAISEQDVFAGPGIYGGGSTSVYYFDSNWKYVSTGEIG